MTLFLLIVFPRWISTAFLSQSKHFEPCLESISSFSNLKPISLKLTFDVLNRLFYLHSQFLVGHGQNPKVQWWPHWLCDLDCSYKFSLAAVWPKVCFHCHQQRVQNLHLFLHCLFVYAALFSSVSLIFELWSNQSKLTSLYSMFSTVLMENQLCQHCMFINTASTAGKGEKNLLALVSDGVKHY